MRRIITPLAALLCASAGLAATEINQASEAELDGLKGIGPALSGKILTERDKTPFRDWPDLMRRVPGIRAKSAARLSDEGLTVNGAGYAPVTGKNAQPPTSLQ